MGFRDFGLGFGVWVTSSNDEDEERHGREEVPGGQGSGFRFQGSGSRVQGSGFRVQGPGSRVQGFRGLPLSSHQLFLNWKTRQKPAILERK